MDRFARLRSTSDRSSRIIEIGPGYSPAAPKADGWQTHVVDHADRASLRAKYAGADANLDLIEEVDTVWQEGPLDDAVPAGLRGRFDTLIASHVIEHIPDLAGFLLAAQRLLGPGGSVVLAIPDRRHCFDCFRPPSSTGEVLQAHTAQRTRHTRRTAWDQLAYAVTIDGALSWTGAATGKPAFIDSFAAAVETNARFDDAATGPYTDYHAWQFTPAGFALVVLELGLLGITDWRIESLDEPDGFEFFVFLRRGAQRFDDAGALQARRMALLQQQAHEQCITSDSADIASSQGFDGSELDAIASRYYTGDGTQKPRLYLAEYEKLFQGIRREPLRILELGISSGASLLTLRDYLPNAIIVGLDIEAPPRRIAGEPRIHSVRGSQDDPGALDEAARLAGGSFDLIIDDASHIGYLTKRAFCYLFPRWLKPGAHYAIEDIGTAFLPEYPDGAPYADPPWNDASPESRTFESHRFGMVGFVKQLIDYTMAELSTGKPGALEIDRLDILTNFALITKSRSGAPPPAAARAAL